MTILGAAVLAMLKRTSLAGGGYRRPTRESMQEVKAARAGLDRFELDSSSEYMYTICCLSGLSGRRLERNESILHTLADR